MEKQISFEESARSLDAQIRNIHESDQTEISEKDEYRILMGEGIEFKAGKLNLIIPPFKIKQIKILNSITDLMLKDIDEVEKLDRIIGVLAEILKVDKKELEENLYKDDLDTILGLCTYSAIKGKDMLKKKRVTAQEMEAVTQYMSVADKA